MAVREVEGHKKSDCSEGLLNRYISSTYLLLRKRTLLYMQGIKMELAAHKCRLFMQKKKWLKYILSFVIVTKILSFKSSLFQAKFK